MGQTTNRASVPYPVVGDGPYGPTQMQAMAETLDLMVTPIFASVSARDLKLTSSLLTEGMRCYVIGVGFFEYSGSAWVSIRRSSEVEMQRTVDQNVATSTWTALGMSSAPYSVGTDLQNTSTGIKVLTAGRYQCEGSYQFAAGSATGRRVIGFGPVSGSAPLTPTPSVPGIANAQDIVMPPVTFQFAVNDVVTIWAFQDTGGNLIVKDRRLLLRRVG